MYHGVAQAMTGMVTPTAVSTLLRLPQSVVLTKYRPSGSGAPTARPTVSPGCVTEPARAEVAVQSDSTPAAANFANLLNIGISLDIRVPWRDSGPLQSILAIWAHPHRSASQRSD